MSVNLLTDYEKLHIEERQSLPDAYLGLPDDEMRSRIAAARKVLGQRLLILGHHSVSYTHLTLPTNREV